MDKIFIIRKIITALITIIVLSWAFFQNELWAKLIILPFLVCSASFLGENIALLFNKWKIAKIFKYIFRICFFAYVLGFLLYMIYYAIINKSYMLLIVVGVYIPFVIYFIKKSFFNKNK